MLTLALLALTAPLVLPTDADPADVLRAADAEFLHATRERGLEGWLSWFAADAVVFPPEGPLAAGTEALGAHYRALPGFPPRGFVWEPESAGIASTGDLGWTVGRAGNDASGTPVWGGQYLTVWRKEPGGAWRVVADCTYQPGFMTTLTGLAGAPVTFGREEEHAFASAKGELQVSLGSWWVADAAGTERGGKYLSVWRRTPDGRLELALETGLQQARR